MYIVYLVSGGYGKPDLVFDNIYFAEEELLKKVRNTERSTAFTYSISIRNINSNHYEQTYYYSGSVDIIANLKFIRIKFPLLIDRDEYREVYIRFAVENKDGNERYSIESQLEDADVSNPKIIYFNSKVELDNWSFYLRGKNLVYVENDIKPVRDEWIKQYFKYSVWVHADRG